MSWQEFYLLNPDSTFSKSRTRDGITKSSQGDFKYVEIGDEHYLQFTHNLENELIGNCSADLQEFLLIISDHKFSSSWHACDGPGLVYQRVP